jgi:hypothetical protein
MKRFSLVLLMVVLAVSTVWAQPTRVRFKPGTSGAQLRGVTTGGPSESGGMNPVSYVLGAKKGQTMTLRVTSDKKNARFGLYAPGMELVEGAQTVDKWSGKLPKSGDYEIIVFPEDEHTNTKFTLDITIR